jgi:hypothetical protein
VKFRVQTTDLLQALSVVSVVTPKPVTPQGAAGYLFVVREGRCYVYARDAVCVARADFPVEVLEGEGSFAYPAGHVDAFRFLGDAVTLEALTEGDRFVVRYETESGASGERSTFDPILLTTCDTDYERATQEVEFPSALLKEAINLGRPFLAKHADNRLEEQYKGLVLFDGSKEGQKGDGHLFASNATQAFFFFCEAFAGKGFEIHGMHLGALVAFLSKSEGVVRIRRGTNYLFVSNAQGHVFGWPRHAKTHERFSYYPLSRDAYVLATSKAVVLNALKLIRTELDPTRDKIKVEFDPTSSSITFGVSDGTAKAKSFPVPVRAVTTPEEGFSFGANIHHLLDLFESVKANDVELRVTVVAADASKGVKKDVAIFRTVDAFRMTPEGKVVIEPEGSFPCKVTRYVPSKD